MPVTAWAAFEMEAEPIPGKRNGAAAVDKSTYIRRTLHKVLSLPRPSFDKDRGAHMKNP
jgi:hypothetical protein